MLKKLWIFLGVVIILFSLALVWYAFTNTPNTGALRLFQMDFLSSISKQVVDPLSPGTVTDAPYVDLSSLGEISPYAQKVTIVKDKIPIIGSDLKNEYITIKANKWNKNPINISDWSIQSMITDVWIGLPQGVKVYQAGVVNTPSDIYLAPGETAIISSRPSPVGVSFHENVCTPFLGTTQTFDPPLTGSCIAPATLMQPTINNIKAYGGECVTLAENTPRCTYLTSSSLAGKNVSQACKDFLIPKLTYTYCVGEKKNDKKFFGSKRWRIFLGEHKRLWKDSYEVIRLLDEKGRTVDVFSY